jgi:hypothetical protein
VVNSVYFFFLDFSSDFFYFPNKNITETMTKVCEILTADPPGANARIPFEKFKEIYSYMASSVEVDIPRKHVEEVCNYLETEWV